MKLGSRLGGMKAVSYKHTVEFILQAGSRQLSRPVWPRSYKQALNGNLGRVWHFSILFMLFRPNIEF